MPVEQQILYLRWDANSPSEPRYVYRIAQRLLVSDVSLGLPGYEQNGGIRTTWKPPARNDRPDGEGTRLIYRGPGFFGGGYRNVICERSPTGFLLRAEARSGFHISNDGHEIHRTDASDWAFDRDVLLGPVMTLSLALQGLFTLHLSAIAVSGRAVCFLGSSGAGKSTAARYLEEQCPGVVRVVDDTAPFLVDQELRLIGGLPQPKMPRTGEGGMEPPPSGVSVLLWLDDANDEMAGIRKLSRGETSRRLAASSIGVRLFDPPLLAEHFRFCARAARCASGYLSSLEKSRESLVTLKRFLVSDAKAAWH